MLILICFNYTLRGRLYRWLAPPYAMLRRQGGAPPNPPAPQPAWCVAVPRCQLAVQSGQAAKPSQQYRRKSTMHGSGADIRSSCVFRDILKTSSAPAVGADLFSGLRKASPLKRQLEGKKLAILKRLELSQLPRAVK